MKPKRKLEIESTPKSIADQLRTLAIEAFVANLQQNEAKRRYEKLRGELLGQMKAMKLKSKIFNDVELKDAEGNVKKVNIEAVVSAPEREKADVQALSKLVDTDTFMSIVSATKTDVVNIAGNAVFEQIKVVSEGEENVTIKPLK